MKLSLTLALTFSLVLWLSLVSVGQQHPLPVDQLLPDVSADLESETSCSHSFTDSNSSTTPDYKLAYGIVQANVASNDCPSKEYCTWDIVARYDIMPTDPNTSKAEELRKWHRGGTTSGKVKWNTPGSFVKPDGNGGFVPESNPSSEGHVRLTGTGPNCDSTSTFTATSVDGTCTVSITLATTCLVSVIHGGGEGDSKKRCH